MVSVGLGFMKQSHSGVHRLLNLRDDDCGLGMADDVCAVPLGMESTLLSSY